jgi:hypothetical protein
MATQEFGEEKEFYQEWSLNTLLSFANSPNIPADQVNHLKEVLPVIQAFCKALSIDKDAQLMKFYTKNCIWLENQLYSPVVRQTKEKTLCMTVGKDQIPLKVSQSEDHFGQAQIYVTAMLSLGSDIIPAVQPLNIKSQPRKFMGQDNKEISVDRLVALVPVTTDRRTFVEIPFLPGKDYMRSDKLAKAYMTGDAAYFQEVCSEELSVAGTGGGGSGPLMDFNRLCRGRWDVINAVSKAAKRHFAIKFSTWRLIDNLQYPTYAFELVPQDWQDSVDLFDDPMVEVWGEKVDGVKPRVFLSEVTQVAIGVKNSSTYSLSSFAPQPGVIYVLGPDPRNSDNIPQLSILPMEAFPNDRLTAVFGQAGSDLLAKRLAAGTEQPVIEAAASNTPIEIVSVTAEDLV